MSAQLQRSIMLSTLRKACPEGVPEDRMPDLGGMWWQERLSELQRDHTIGWEMVDGVKTYFLVSGVEQADSAGPVEGPPVGSTVGLLSTENDTLFDAPARSPYDEREAA